MHATPRFWEGMGISQSIYALAFHTGVELADDKNQPDSDRRTNTAPPYSLFFPDSIALRSSSTRLRDRCQMIDSRA